MAAQYDMERSTPQQEGLSSFDIEHALDYLDSRGVPLHALLIARNGKLVYENYYAPWKRENLHRLYSISKSFVSLAIGFLLEDGSLRLSDRIVDYFPDKVPENVHPWLNETTIEHMLSMSTCHSRTTYKRFLDGRTVYADDYAGSFFTVPPDHRPGTIFKYDTSSSHVLAALVERVGGMPLVEYLSLKLFSPLGIHDISWMADPQGLPMGGSGLSLRPYDLMKVLHAIAYSNIVPATYLASACSRRMDISTGDFRLPAFSGYGWQFWTLADGGWCMYGMGGQFAIAMPDRNFLAVTTADTEGLQGDESLLLETVISLSAGKAGTQAEPKERMLRHRSGLSHAKRETNLSGRTYRTDGALASVRLSFGIDSGEATLLFRDGSEDRITFGLGRNVPTRCELLAGQECVASCAWSDEATCVIEVQSLGRILGKVVFEVACRHELPTFYLKVVGEFGTEALSGCYPSLP
ncbi:MAG: serine hydrolase domain-containing protein [Sphaerochaetaceae bacterium]|jgi:CubicO group peptidase (beta-lactamase class C family)